MRALLHSIYDQPGPEAVHAQFDRVVEDLDAKLPKVADHLAAAREDILAFQKILVEAGMICTIRSTRGDDIDAACGQLVGQVQDRTRRAERWQSRQGSAREIFRSAT